jgi:hypothetical protein
VRVVIADLPISITQCSNCTSPLSTHQACKDCGFYKGIKVLRTKNDRLMERTHVRQEKAERKATATQQATQNQE